MTVSCFFGIFDLQLGHVRGAIVPMFKPLNMLSRYVLSLGTGSLDVLMGTVQFYAPYLRFIGELISFWAKPFNNWKKILPILYIKMGLQFDVVPGIV